MAARLAAPTRTCRPRAGPGSSRAAASSWRPTPRTTPCGGTRACSTSSTVTATGRPWRRTTCRTPCSVLSESSPWLRLLLLLSVGAACYGIVIQRAHWNRPAPLRVAAASDLQGVFDELRTAFAEEHPEIPVEVTFGSSGTLYAQL